MKTLDVCWHSSPERDFVLAPLRSSQTPELTFVLSLQIQADEPPIIHKCRAVVRHSQVFCLLKPVSDGPVYYPIARGLALSRGVREKTGTQRREVKRALCSRTASLAFPFRSAKDKGRCLVMKPGSQVWTAFTLCLQHARG